ncbi:hypothetical protein E2C01_068144 [Portunus trituberculatus]|uniref:Uncharacterized protein n=1 Tax=Portunus trituberculatus TaxID=210409 RepID=A0A5B7HVR4_PORTR|nr:hypothetical protein [Portunus trituberculatus]
MSLKFGVTWTQRQKHALRYLLSCSLCLFLSLSLLLLHPPPSPPTSPSPTEFCPLTLSFSLCGSCISPPPPPLPPPPLAIIHIRSGKASGVCDRFPSADIALWCRGSGVIAVLKKVTCRYIAEL